MADDSLMGSSIYSFYKQEDKRLLGQLQELKSEGEGVNKADPAFSKASQVMNYVMGDQVTGNHPSYLHHVVVNQMKKAIRTHVSALTDIKPLFEWKTYNQNFTPAADILNRRTNIWWVNNNVDLTLADVIRYSLCAGSGDMLVEYDPFFKDGDNRVFARDPRDTLPIKPESEPSVQTWEGVTIREKHSVDRLRNRFPGEAHKITEDTGKMGQLFSKFRKMVMPSSDPSPLQSMLDGARGKGKPFPECTLYRTFIRDRSRNLSHLPVLVGKPGTNWSYMVEPAKPLYPRGRLILWTEAGILSDCGNPYWHGMFPLARLKLDPWPWLFGGLGLAHDLMPAQDILNVTVNDFMQVFSQWVNRGSVWDKNMPESQFARFDPRQPHWKVRKPNNVTAGFQAVDGPTLPPWSMDFLNVMFQKFDELAETGNLQALMQLRQMPGAETMEKFSEALTPGIRLEARQLEVFLRDVAVMWKSNTFQFESQAKRLMLLGDIGTTLQDLDWNPGTMIPAMKTMDEGYIPELDADLPQEQRAQFFSHQFSFYVSPNSLLALHASERKMLYIQLSRMGYLDFWTLMEMLDVPNVGLPPALPLPVINWKAPEPQVGPDGMTLPPSPPPVVVRIPETITEKLMAMQQLGIGMTSNPAGRKASGDQPPHMEQGSNGNPTIKESR